MKKERDYIVNIDDKSFIGIDFGKEESNDNAILSIWVKKKDYYQILSTKVVGKSKDFNDEKIKQYLQNLKKNKE